MMKMEEIQQEDKNVRQKNKEGNPRKKKQVDATIVGRHARIERWRRGKLFEKFQ